MKGRALPLPRAASILMAVVMSGSCVVDELPQRDAATPPTPPAAPPAAVQPVTFVDVTNEAGVHFRHNSGAFGRKYLPETMGSGAAFLDVDGDGWQDIFLVN